MWRVKDKLGYRIIISQNTLDYIQGLCYNSGNTKANERLCMKKIIKVTYEQGEGLETLTVINWGDEVQIVWSPF